jgi:hypothetical protein
MDAAHFKDRKTITASLRTPDRAVKLFAEAIRFS